MAESLHYSQFSVGVIKAGQMILIAALSYQPTQSALVGQLGIASGGDADIRFCQHTCINST